jgi:hypothetical protein
MGSEGEKDGDRGSSTGDDAMGHCAFLSGSDGPGVVWVELIVDQEMGFSSRSYGLH